MYHGMANQTFKTWLVGVDSMNVLQQRAWLSEKAACGDSSRSCQAATALYHHSEWSTLPTALTGTSAISPCSRHEN